MGIIASIVLGIIEGVTEFLPVSSTGHLILTAEILKLPTTDFLKSFEVIIQLGAIGAVVVLYWRKLLLNRAVLKRVIVAFLPTAVIGLLAYKFIKTYLLGDSRVVLLALFAGGLILVLFEFWQSRRSLRSLTSEPENLAEMPYWQAVVLGLCQSVAMIPGVSRSAATIVGGLALGLKRETTVEFSFLLAVPTMVAATSLDLVKSSVGFSLNEWGLLLVGFMVAFLSALLAIKSFLNYIRHHDFIAFGLYRMIIALAFASTLFI